MRPPERTLGPLTPKCSSGRGTASPKGVPARGQREPSLIVLLEYARVAGVCVDVLINDRLDLPAKLRAKAKHS